MNISALFISRPVMTTLVWLGVFISGVMAYFSLPVNDMPNVDFPVINVSAYLPGASPETMAVSVATPLEREFSAIAGIDSMTSSSRQGSTTITLLFALERDIDAAAQDVQTAIAKTQGKLPSDMPDPPILRKVNPADRPVLYLSLSSSTLPLSLVHEYADVMLAQRMSTISGVAQVSIYGSQKYAVRIQLDPKILASRGIGIDQVAQAVKGGNVILPVGSLSGDDYAYTLQASGQLHNAQEYKNLVVLYQNGRPVRLRDLGQVADSVEENRIANWVNSRRAITLAIQRQPGANTIEVVDAVKNMLPALQAQMPAGIDMQITYDRSQSIRDSVADVKFTLALSAGLVIMVVFLFLRNLSATVITSLAAPLSIIGAFALMERLDFSLNNISLMGMTLAVGFVVDDAIVMLENITRHL
jgi:HAE1 family hydrophobic/amphiphilic exporter-1